MSNNFFIKSGYKPFVTKKNQTVDVNREIKYWDKSRIKLSYNYQWHVYKFAKNIMISNSKILDIGCGTAHKLVNIIGSKTKNIFGIDQENPISYCKQKHLFGNYIVDDFENSKIEYIENIDLLLCVDVIEHIYNPDILLDYIKNHSNPNTQIIISTPDRDKLRGYKCMQSQKAEHIREWNFEEFKNYIKYSGFTIEKHFHCPPMRLTFSNILEYFYHRLTQFKGKSLGKSFDYNQVILCKHIKVS
tara:strand:+ start:2362 stop:3096 length:735 start_codon:yes stop_codon:yes gene_type:complete